MSDNTLLMGGVIFLGVLVVVAIVLVVMQLVGGRSGGGDSGGGGGGGNGNHGQHDYTTADPLPPPSYTCKSTVPEKDPILYVMPEANGFDVDDLVPYLDPKTNKKSLIDPSVAQQLFKGGVAVVANYSARDFETQYTHELVTNLGIPIIKWVVFYFGKDGFYCRCQNGADKNGNIQCSDVGVPCNTCKVKDDMVKWQPGPCNLCKTNDPSNPNKPCFPGESIGSVVEDLYAVCNKIDGLRGIMYDDETGDPKNTVVALELVKEKWDQHHPDKPPLMLGSTGTVSSSKNDRPRNEQGNCTWDIVLGQAYTDTTADYYAGSCKPDLSSDDEGGSQIPAWWAKVAKALGTSPSSKGVPMVCGAGDCVGDVSAKSGDAKCYDERLSGAVITELLQKRPGPSEFQWRNFGIWYGTTAAPCGFQGCYANSDCTTRCCETEWEHNPAKHKQYC